MGGSVATTCYIMYTNLKRFMFFSITLKNSHFGNFCEDINHKQWKTSTVTRQPWLQLAYGMRKGFTLHFKPSISGVKYSEYEMLCRIL